MSDDGAKGSTWRWTAQKEKAALLLSQGVTWKVLEHEHGIPHSTLGKWVKAPEFKARIDAHHDEIIEEARRLLRRNALVAAQKLVQMAEYGTAQHMAKLAAAKDILDRVGLKAPEKHEHSGANNQPLGPTIQIVALDYRTAVAALTTGPVIDSAASGEGEGFEHGPALGQDGARRLHLAGDGESGG